jgi:3-oxoacyl-[acyl-carrier-protein] synthase II
MALADAHIAPSEVGHVNAHGTATRLNDQIEAIALSEVFGPYEVPVTAPKGVTGHMIGASGGAEVLAALLAARDRHVPPVANLTDPDGDIPADVVSGSGRRVESGVALSNSFAFGGHNVCIVVRADPTDDRPATQG